MSRIIGLGALAAFSSSRKRPEAAIAEAFDRGGPLAAPIFGAASPVASNGDVLPVRLPGIAAKAPAVRRRRLWEISTKYHCPLIGVCFDVAELRRIVGKKLDYPADTTDYVWHTIAVGVCEQRCDLSEQFNRLLDRRYAVMIKRLSACKTADELRQAWREICRSGVDIPAGLWAASTHPACDKDLEQEVQADIHMIQHQVGVGARVDLRAMRELEEENRKLRQENTTLRQRHDQMRAAHADEVRQFNQRIGGLQAELSANQAEVRRQQGELTQLRASMPDLGERQSLQLRLQETKDELLQTRERETRLLGELNRLQDFAAYAEQTIEALALEPRTGDAPECPVCPESSTSAENLIGKCVLCVGGRLGSVNSYRMAVEQQGGRFLHHDGGREESLHRIDGALAAADIVICQVGCISHNAYWRVKEQCKRTGKPCVFVKSGGVSSFGRLIGLASKDASGE